MTAQELRLQEEFRKLEEYRSALERKEEETRQAEAARKEKLYALALTKSETDDILQLTEAIVPLETIIDYKNAVELIAKIRIRISQISARSEEQKASYRRNNLCQHCGGKFKGLFSKQCRVCGKKKDY